MLLLASLLLTRPAIAQDEGDLSIGEITIGLDGKYRVGCFTQVQVEVESSVAQAGVELEIELPDGEGVRSVNVTKNVQLKAGTNRLVAYLKFGRVDSDVTVRVVKPDGWQLAERDFAAGELPDAVLGSQHLVVTLGPDIGVDPAVELRYEKTNQGTIHSVIQSTEGLPENWLGYGGVSLVILPASEAGIVSNMSVAQLDALEDWVRMGGRLLFSCGASSETMLGQQGPLARFSPGVFDRVQMQRQTSGIENYAGKTARSLDSFVPEGELSFRMPMAALTDVLGNVVVAEGIGSERTAFITRSSLDFGHVIFVAADLDQAPFSKWTDGRRRIVGKLLDLALGDTKRDDSDNQYSQLTQIGFDDLTGQLRASLDQFPSVKMVPFSWIATLVGLYIALIGPIDYFLLRRMQKRFSLTWITFPLMVIVGCLLAYFLTQYWKGHAVRINQVDVVDIDAETGFLRDTTWAHLFSPTSQKYDLALGPTDQVLPFQTLGQISSWQGLPGSSFGGMNTTRVSQTSDSYRVVSEMGDDSNQLSRVYGIPIDIYASRSVSGLTWGRADLPKPEPFTPDADNQLDGIVRNPLPVTLRDCKLFYGRWVYPLPTLAAGGEFEIDRFSKIKTIDGMLTKTLVDQDFKDLSQAWDRKTFDLNRIMEVIMFHKAGGGYRYTQLLHRFQGEIDFTDHLTQGHALLVGTTEESPINLVESEDVETKTETYVRIMLPVNPRSRGRE